MRHTPDTADVKRMIDRALSTERHRIRTLLLEVAAKFGGPAQAFAEAMAAALDIPHAAKEG